MSAARGRPRKRGKKDDEHPDERWMASYMDMVTVLMCMFIVLYAMSTVDQGKFVKLKESLATGFGTVQEGKIDTAKGVVVPAKQVGKNGLLSSSSLDQALTEVDTLNALQQEMHQRLESRGLQQNVVFQIDERGLTVKLVGSQAFFLPDSPQLSARAAAVLATIAPVLVKSVREVSVEGHAANAITNYPSVWELSADRSVGVLRYLVDHGGMPGGRISAVGFGASRQVNNDSTEALRELNRRVDIVVLSNEPSEVRAFIPEALKIRAGHS